MSSLAGASRPSAMMIMVIFAIGAIDDDKLMHWETQGQMMRLSFVAEASHPWQVRHVPMQ